CALGTLGNGRHATITIAATVDAVGTEANTAKATSANPNPNPGGASSSARTKLTPVLRLSKRASRTHVAAGQTITYTIVATNPTSVAIRHVQVCDRVPSGLVVAS